MLKKLADKLWFRLWKWYVYSQMEIQQTSPLVSFPLTVWIELEAERILNEKGRQDVIEAAQERLVRIVEAFTNPPPPISPDYRGGILRAAELMGVSLTDEDITEIEKWVPELWNYLDAEAVAISRYLREKNEAVSDPG